MARSQAPLALEYVLLGFVDQQPTHGYDLYKQLQSSDIDLVWKVKQSQLYALLDKLEELGLLASTPMAGESYPQRKQYDTTSLGRQTFLAWMRSPVYHGREMRQEFLARLYFARLDGPETVQELMEAQREACQGWLNEMEIDFEKLGDNGGYRGMVQRFRILETQAMLAWLEECEKSALVVQARRNKI